MLVAFDSNCGESAEGKAVQYSSRLLAKRMLVDPIGYWDIVCTKEVASPVWAAHETGAIMSCRLLNPPTLQGQPLTIPSC